MVGLRIGCNPDQRVAVVGARPRHAAAPRRMAGTAPGIVAEERRHAERQVRSEEHTSELQSLMRTSYAVFCLKKHKIRATHKTRMSTKNDYNTTRRPVQY